MGKILIIIIILIILAIIIYYYYYMVDLNNFRVAPSELPYNKFDDFNDLSDKKNISLSASHLINYAMASYNDLFGFPLFIPSGVTLDNVYHITTTLDVLGHKFTNKTGLVYVFGDIAIIAFRGTCLNVDEVIDAEIKYYDYPSTDISVHRGFHNYYTGMGTQITDIINNSSIKTVFVTGHSMGSSVGLIMAYELNILFPDLTINLYLFACPKSGNKAFTSLFNSYKTVTTVSIINYFDIVPEAPEYINQMYAVQPIYIFGIENDSDVDNHSLITYGNGINCMELLNTNCN